MCEFLFVVNKSLPVSDWYCMSTVVLHNQEVRHRPNMTAVMIYFIIFSVPRQTCVLVYVIRRNANLLHHILTILYQKQTHKTIPNPKSFNPTTP